MKMKSSAFWKNIAEDDAFYQTVNYPTALYGGWWDLFLPGTLDGFRGFNELSQDEVKGTSKVFIDPCGHCLDAQSLYPGHTVEGRSIVFVAQLFELFGVRPVKRSAVKAVTFYVMSSNDERPWLVNIGAALMHSPQTSLQTFLILTATAGASIDGATLRCR